MTIIPEKYTTPGRKAINARVAAVAFCAAGGGLALLLGSAGWALAGLLVWAISASVGFSMARATKDEVSTRSEASGRGEASARIEASGKSEASDRIEASGPVSSATSLDKAAVLTYLKNNPDSAFATEVAEALRVGDNDKVSE
jgi:hypothetical protein